MRKIVKHIVAIVLLCAVCFLGGTWPNNTPLKKVVVCDGAALATVLVCGLYLRKAEKK